MQGIFGILDFAHVSNVRNISNALRMTTKSDHSIEKYNSKSVRVARSPLRIDHRTAEETFTDACGLKTPFSRILKVFSTPADPGRTGPDCAESIHQTAAGHEFGGWDRRTIVPASPVDERAGKDFQDTENGVFNPLRNGKSPPLSMQYGEECGRLPTHAFRCYIFQSSGHSVVVILTRLEIFF